MFRRLFVEEGYLLLPIVSLVLVMLAFSIFAVRILRTPKDKIDKTAAMPLRDDDSPPAGPAQ